LDFDADGTVMDTEDDIVYHLSYSIQDRNLYLGDGQFYIKTLSDTELVIFDHFQEDGANMLEEIGFRRDK
jgi:hypothetical protein